MEIKIENLIKEYDNNFMALNQINLTMNSGMMGLLGANGAGKSTLIKILAGILNATSGEIIVDGERIKKSSNLKKIVGYVPQKFDFYPQMIFILGLPASGKSTFINKYLPEYFQSLKHARTLDSDIQLHKRQKQNAMAFAKQIYGKSQDEFNRIIKNENLSNTKQLSFLEPEHEG